MKESNEPRNQLLESLLRFLRQEGQEYSPGLPTVVHVTTYDPPKPEEPSSPLGSALGLNPRQRISKN